MSDLAVKNDIAGYLGLVAQISPALIFYLNFHAIDGATCYYVTVFVALLITENTVEIFHSLATKTPTETQTLCFLSKYQMKNLCF